MSKEKYILEIQKLAPTVLSEEIVKVVKEVIEDFKFDDYHLLVDKIGKPQEFINNYFESREVDLRKISESGTLKTKFKVYSRILTKKRLIRTYYGIIVLSLLFLIVVASLPFFIDFNYNRILTKYEWGNDAIVDTVFDDDRTMYILGNDGNLVESNQNEESRLIKTEFLHSNWLIYQLIPKISGVGAMLYFQHLDNKTITIKEFSYDKQNQVWSKVYDFNYEDNCISLCGSQIFWSSDGSETNYYFVTKNSVNNTNWYFSQLNENITSIINQTRISEIAGLNLNLTRIRTGIVIENKLHLLMSNDGSTRYSVYYNETTEIEIGMDELNYYNSIDAQTRRTTTYNFTYLILDTTTHYIGNYNLTYYPNDKTIFYQNNDQILLLVQSGGFDANYQNHYQIFEVTNNQFILKNELKRSDLTIEDLRIAPSIQNEELQIYFTGNNSFYKIGADGIINKLDSPRLIGMGGSVSYQGTGAIQTYVQLPNVRNWKGLTDVVIYIGQDQYNSMISRYYDIQTISVIVLDNTYNPSSPDIEVHSQNIIILSIFLFIFLLLFPRLRQIVRNYRNRVTELNNIQI